MRQCTLVVAMLVAALGLANAQTAPYSWQQPQAKVLPTGDLQWAPKPFEFKPGASIRYIDFASGNDANDGLSKQTPWKHHPWDPNATGNAKACERHPHLRLQAGRRLPRRDERGRVRRRGQPHHPDARPHLGQRPGRHLRLGEGGRLEAGRRQPADPRPAEGLVCRPRLGAAQRLDRRPGRQGHPHRPRPHPELDHHRPGRHQEQLVDVEEPGQAVRQLRHGQRPEAPHGLRQGAHQHQPPGRLLQGRHRLDEQGLGDGQPLPGARAGGEPAGWLPDLPRPVGRRTVLPHHPRLPLLPGGQAAVPGQPGRVLVRQEGRRRPSLHPPARRPGPEHRRRRGRQARPHDREPRA